MVTVLASHLWLLLEKSLPKSCCSKKSQRNCHLTHNVDSAGTSVLLYCGDGIHSMAQEKCRVNQNTFIAFINLSKVFDTVRRELLWNILLKFSCPQRFANNSKCDHWRCQSFRVCTGMRKVFILALIHFNIYLLDSQ